MSLPPFEKVAPPEDKSAPAQKARPAPVKDHCFDIVIRISEIKSRDDLVHHATRKRIHFVGAIQRDGGNSLTHVIDDVLKIHDLTLAMRGHGGEIGLDVEELAGCNARAHATGNSTNYKQGDHDAIHVRTWHDQSAHTSA